MKSIKEEKQMKPCADTAEDTHFSEGENEVAWPSNEKANRTATSNPAEVKVEEDQEGSDGMLYKTFNAGCVTDTNHSLPRREVAVKMEPVGDEDALPIQTIVQTQESTTGSISRVAEHSKSASVSKSPESLLEAVHPETPNGKETETESNPVSALPTIEVAGNSSPQDQQDLQGSKRAIRTISRPKYITRSVLNALRSPPCSSTTSDSSVSKVSTTATPAKTTSASPLEASSCSSRSATSNSSPEYSSSASSSKTPQRKKPNGAINQTLFPFNLARFLRAAIKSNPDVVYWSSTGNVFFINSRSSSNMEIIGQLVAPFFKHSNYDALRRQLNLYEFTRLTEGAYVNYHSKSIKLPYPNSAPACSLTRLSF
uniref:HSF-type DNA-binding domain-containing protein n=1 Tax=Entomoneis paludosa TaxID=265537 RepID=A0A7S2Y346_9STRA|mmetsp:Transcript_12630/g.26155  ORF Transcript_12630/g.26155 Transcript_12630/m.26155 type:complete len:370 (+) Transcript_12630:178-1287(+)